MQPKVLASTSHPRWMPWKAGDQQGSHYSLLQFLKVATICANPASIYWVGTGEGLVKPLG